jgi:hypothetical protein
VKQIPVSQLRISEHIFEHAIISLSPSLSDETDENTTGSNLRVHQFVSLDLSHFYEHGL